MYTYVYVYLESNKKAKSLLKQNKMLVCRYALICISLHAFLLVNLLVLQVC